MTTYHHLEGEETNWIDLVQHKDVLFDERVMFTYVVGGMTIICRCFKAIIVAPSDENFSIKEKLRKHLCYHRIRKDEKQDMPPIPEDSTSRIGDFVTLVRPMIKDARLVSVPCDLLSIFGMTDCPKGFKAEDVKYCIPCGSVSNSDTYGQRLCNCDIEPCLCPGYVTFYSNSDSKGKNCGPPLICGFPTHDLHVKSLVSKLKLKSPQQLAADQENQALVELLEFQEAQQSQSSTSSTSSSNPLVPASSSNPPIAPAGPAPPLLSRMECPIDIGLERSQVVARGEEYAKRVKNPKPIS
jgi:hypothetical protein